jgi:2-phospho-L-lactate guanylyltransferase
LKEHAQSITSILADIPLAEPKDFIELSTLGGDEPKVVIVPSLNGGTNVMTIAPPNAIAPAYGRWSYAKHLRLAQRRQLKTYSMSNPRISFDIDTMADLVKLRRLDSGKRTSSGKVVSEMARVANPKRTIGT